jgi:hypothetical protein
VAAREELQKIATDPAAFVAALDDPQAKGGPIGLPDGSTVPRLPGFRRWMWDGAFCSSIGLRWQPGTNFACGAKQTRRREVRMSHVRLAPRACRSAVPPTSLPGLT